MFDQNPEMRPELLKKLEVHNAENTEELRKMLQELDIPFKEVEAGAGHFGFSLKADAYSKFKSGTTKNLEEAQFRALIYYLYSKGYWSNRAETIQQIEAIDDALFHAFTRFLKIGVATQENMTARVPGTYRVWQPSLHLPGSFVMGMMQISFNPKSRALWANETQQYKWCAGTRDRREVFNGYILRKGKKYIILARDENSESLRVRILHRWQRDGGSVITMSGACVGIYNGNLFAAPTYLERYEGDDGALENELDIVPEERVPPSVLARIRRDSDVTIF